MQENISLSDIDSAPITTAAPHHETKPETYELLWDRFSTVSNEKIELQSELDRLKSIGATNAILDSLIEPYASRTFLFMCCYCSFVALMLVAELFGRRLPDSVMEVLVGSTAVTVVGLVGMVLTGIFVGARHRLR